MPSENPQFPNKGEPWFLSNLTNKLLDRTGPMDGSLYWYFKGKNLKDLQKLIQWINLRYLINFQFFIK